jgi:hypothetical protein
VPNYFRIGHLQIDWQWPLLSESERATVRRCEARFAADPEFGGIDGFYAAVAAASRELPGRTVRARASGATAEEEHELAVRAHDGVSEDDDGDLDEEGACQDPLTLADYRAAGATRAWVPLYWPEEMLGLLQDTANRLDVSLSQLAERAWQLTKTSSAEPASLPRGGSRRLQSLFLPVETMFELQEAANASDRSNSSVMQEALAAAWSRLTS